jgi:hypothetical protein
MSRPAIKTPFPDSISDEDGSPPSYFRALFFCWPLKSNARATAVLVDEFCAAASKVLHPNIGRVRLCGGASSGSFSTSSSYLSILNANLSSVSPSTADRKLVCFEEKLQSPVD